MKKVYLGDSVYAAFEHGMIVLTTENGYGPTNTIYLEDFVYGALKRFVNSLRESDESQDTPSTDSEV